MSVAAYEAPGLLVIVEDGAPEAQWHEGRDEGVTATDVAKLAGARSTKIRGKLLDDKLNGSTFKGNAHTRRGHENEPKLIAAAAFVDGVTALDPSHALFGFAGNPLHRATPDGLGVHEEHGYFGAEVKHRSKPMRGGIPRAHRDQMLWGMHVLDADAWLYAWGVEGTDGLAGFEWVERDDARIEQLVAIADEFIAWRAAGAPAPEGLPSDIDALVARRARKQQKAARLTAEYKALDEEIKAWAIAQGAKPGAAVKMPGTSAAVFYEPKPDQIVLDETKWAAAEPASYAEYLETHTRLAEQASAAAVLYNQPKPVAATFRVTPNGDPK
jgi:hypothetical protein